MRVMYSYNEVSTPPWVMQALVKCAGIFVMSLVEAKLPTNWDNMSPKCWEAFTKIKWNALLNNEKCNLWL